MSGIALASEVKVPAASGHTAEKDPLFAPDVQVLFLTWVTFFALLFILQKFAWKPILKGLSEREEGIRRAVDEAEKTRQEYLDIENKRKKIMLDADTKARGIIQESRQTAINAAHVINENAKEEAKILLENAEREIAINEEKASHSLREKSADTAVRLASKIIGEEMDAKRHKKLIDEFIKEL